LKRAEVDGTHAGIAQLSLQQGTATEKRKVLAAKGSIVAATTENS